MKKTYISPAAEAMDFCAEGNILANSINVDAAKTTDVMFSGQKQFTKSIWLDEVNE